MKRTFWLAALALAALMAVGCNKKAEAQTSGGTVKVSGKVAPESDFEVTLIENDTAVAITGYNGSAKTLVIPSTIQGYPVHKISISVDDKCKAVSIPEGVVEIYGLKSGPNLETVALPESLKFITQGAFRGCGLKSISFPKGLLVIGREAFKDCQNLTDVDFSSATSLKLIGYQAFSGTPIKKAALPDSLKYIGLYAFKDCDNLSIETISLSDSPDKIIGLWSGDNGSWDDLFTGAKLSEEKKSSDLKIQKAFKDEFASKIAGKMAKSLFNKWQTGRFNYSNGKEMLTNDIPGTSVDGEWFSSGYNINLNDDNGEFITKLYAE